MEKIWWWIIFVMLIVICTTYVYAAHRSLQLSPLSDEHIPQDTTLLIETICFTQSNYCNIKHKEWQNVFECMTDKCCLLYTGSSKFC